MLCDVFHTLFTKRCISQDNRPVVCDINSYQWIHYLYHIRHIKLTEGDTLLGIRPDPMSRYSNLIYLANLAVATAVIQFAGVQLLRIGLIQIIGYGSRADYTRGYVLLMENELILYTF